MSVDQLSAVEDLLTPTSSVSGYYRDSSYRDRYPRDDRYDQRYSRGGWSGPSRTRSPEPRRDYDDSRYFDSRERDRYADRRQEIPYRDRDREQEMDRRGPYAPRRDYRDRDRERELEYYDRVPPSSRSQWNDPQDRSFSPQSTRRPSPPYTSARHPASPPYDRREEYSRRAPQAVEALYRDESIPTGPRATSGSYPRSSAMPPTAPRSHFNQPPLKANTSYDGRSAAPPLVPSSNRQTDRRSDDGDKSASASSLPTPAAVTTSNDAQSYEGPPKPQAPVEMKEPEVPEVPVIPIKERLGALISADFKGSCCPDLEADAFNTSTARLRSFNSMYTRPEFVSLRKALSDLADCEMEVAGAKTRTSITESALAAAKEEAEAWSLESARIEVKERNLNPQEWFSVQQQQQIV